MLNSLQLCSSSFLISIFCKKKESVLINWKGTFLRWKRDGQGQSYSLLGAAVAQKAERVICQSEGGCFDPQLFLSASWSVLGQDSELQIGPDGCSIGVWMCVYEFLKSRLALWREATLPLVRDQVCEWVNTDLCCKSALKALYKYCPFNICSLTSLITWDVPIRSLRSESGQSRHF